MTSPYLTDLVQIRRDLHRIPELSMQEVKTTAYIHAFLHQLGVEWITPPDLPTATLVHLKGNCDTTIGLRADIDALPIHEKTRHDYLSQHPGVMHACGHDGHTAMLMVTLKHCLKMQQEGKLACNVVFIFQPAEESIGGAEQIILSGILQPFKIEAFFALHVSPYAPARTLASCQGPIMASATEVEVRIRGQKAHVGLAFQGADALLAGAYLVTLVQSGIKNTASALHPVIVHFGKMHAGDAVNVVADHCSLEGTIRTYHDEDLKNILHMLESACHSVSTMFRVEAELLRPGGDYPPLINDVALTTRMEQVAQQAGIEYNELPEPYVFGEDFSFYRRLAPIQFTFLGIRDESKGHIHGLHTDEFDLDENCLCIGVEYLLEMVESYRS